MYHQLHCVVRKFYALVQRESPLSQCQKFLRQWKHRENYFLRLSKEEEQRKDVHADKVSMFKTLQLKAKVQSDHCIEMLRSAALCRADTSSTTFHWESQAKPMLDLKRPSHICVNWENLKTSIEHRVVSEEEGSRLFNPILADPKLRNL